MKIPPPRLKPTGKLDPRTMLIDTLQTVARFGWVLILFLIFRAQGRGTDTFELMAAGLAIFGVFGSLVRWLTVRFGVVGEHFIYETTWLNKTEKHIPLDRIQAVNIEQNIAQRALGLAKVHIDTAAGGTEAEVTLDSISLKDAEALRIQLTKPGELSETNLEAPLWRATSRDLFLAGVTNNSWPIIVGGIVSFLPFSRGDDSLVRAAIRSGRNTPAPTILLVIGGLIVAGWIFSMILAWVKFYGFTLTQKDGRLHREYGLLNNQKSSVPLRRIQSLDWGTTWLRRWVGFWEVRCFTAGGMKIKQDPTTGGILCPVVPAEKLRTFTALVFPDLDWAGLRWVPVPMRAFWIEAYHRLLIYGILLIPLGWFYPAWIPGIAAAWLILNLLSAWLEVRSMKAAFASRYVFIQSGWRNTRLLIVPLDKVQCIDLHQSFLQRKLSLATLSFDVPATNGVSIRNMPVEVLSRTAERSVPWIANTGAWSPDGV